MFLLIALALDGLLAAALLSYAQLLLRVQGLFLFESAPWSLLLVTSLVVVVAVAYVLTRTSLSLPAAAIGRLASPKAIWRWSRGNGWRLTATVVASVLLACVFWGVLFLALALASFPPDHPPVRLLAGVAGYLPTPYLIAVLSCAYRALALEPRSAPSH